MKNTYYKVSEDGLLLTLTNPRLNPRLISTSDPNDLNTEKIYKFDSDHGYRETVTDYLFNVHESKYRAILKYFTDKNKEIYTEYENLKRVEQSIKDKSLELHAINVNLSMLALYPDLEHGDHVNSADFSLVNIDAEDLTDSQLAAVCLRQDPSYFSLDDEGKRAAREQARSWCKAFNDNL